MRCTLVMVGCLALAAGCPSAEGPGASDDEDAVATPTPPPLDLGEPVSAKADLRMKRWRQISLDLQGALELPPDAICTEMGLFDCSGLHGAAIGGVSVDNGLYRPVDDRLPATAGPAIERMVLHACTMRAHEDELARAEGEQPVVFSLDPSASALTEGEGEVQIEQLYRRLLARDPLPQEVEALLAMHPDIVGEGGTNLDWAWMACFAVGTTTEALLY